MGGRCGPNTKIAASAPPSALHPFPRPSLIGRPAGRRPRAASDGARSRALARRTWRVRAGGRPSSNRCRPAEPLIASGVAQTGAQSRPIATPLDPLDLSKSTPRAMIGAIDRRALRALTSQPARAEHSHTRAMSGGCEPNTKIAASAPPSALHPFPPVPRSSAGPPADGRERRATARDLAAHLARPSGRASV